MQEQIVVGDRTRTYIAVGDRDGASGRPLVLVFHGSRQDGQVHREFTGGVLDPLAEEGRAVVVYLDGYRGNWNDARREDRFPARREGIDDVAFVDAVIDRMAETYGIDPRRTVGVGYSNGGQMVMRLLHDVPGLLAGAVVIAAGLPTDGGLLLPDPEPPAVPTSIIVIHGTADPITPYAGGAMPWWARMLFRVGGRSLSAPDTARYFARRNGITVQGSALSVASAAESPDLPVEIVEYRQSPLPPVTLITVAGGGHTIPGPTPAPAAFLVGRTTAAISLRDVVVDMLDGLDG